ncbi:MAG: hypothetical protein FRX49_10738 [Trebouxia sp. A1-2]|nr:MAG: hypothetical protein FRX49_10738 [Trebouxia sp. A1-2]
MFHETQDTWGRNHLIHNVLPRQLASRKSTPALALCVGAKGDLHSVCATTHTLAPSPSPRGPSLMFTDRSP